MRETAQLAPWGAKEMAVWRHALEIEGWTRSYLMFHSLELWLSMVRKRAMDDGRVDLSTHIALRRKVG